MYCVFLGKARETVTVPTITKDKLNLISTSSSAGLEVKGDGTTDGTIQLNCSQNSHGIKLASPPHSAGQSYTLTFPQSISADTFLKTDGSGNLSFAAAGGTNTPYFYATLSGNQTLSDATNTKIAFNTASIDSDSAFDTSNNRFVVPSGKAGKYYIYGQINSDSGDVEYLETTIAKNGTEINYIINNPSSSHSNLQTNIATIVDLAASDYVELFVSSNQTSGNATITASVRGKNSYLLGYKLSE
jgi:hypothetical protein